MMKRHGGLVATVLVAGAMQHGPALAQTAVGKVAAVNPASVGLPPGGASRTLELNSQVIYREKITTSAAGSLQLIFTDTSTLSIGPNSDLVIDEYVFDPATGNGKMALSLGRGVLRFVGGENSHRGNAQIRTPVATIGMRGAAGTVTHDARSGATRLLSSFGSFTFSTAFGSEDIRRPGFVVSALAGQAPLPPQRATQAEFDSLTRNAASKPGQFGSAGAKPTEAKARSLLSQDAIRTAPSSYVALSGVVSDTSADVAKPFDARRDDNKLAQTSNVEKAAELVTNLTTLDTRKDPEIVSRKDPEPDIRTDPGIDTGIDIARIKSAIGAAIAAAESAFQSLAETRDAALAAALAAESAAPNASKSPASSTARIAAANQAAAARTAANAAVAAYSRALAALSAARTQRDRLGGVVSLATAQAALAEAVAQLQAAFLAAGDFTTLASAAVTAQVATNNAVTASKVAAPQVFALRMSAGAGSSVPYLSGGFISSGTAAAATISPVLATRPGGAVAPDGLSATPGQIKTLQVGFSLNGQGSGQSSAMLVATGRSLVGDGSSGNPFDLVGGFFASGRRNASQGPSFASGNVTTQDRSVSVDEGLIPTTFAVDGVSTGGGASTPSQTQYFGFGGAATYNYAQTASATETPAGLGVARAGAPLTGYVSGLMTSVLSTTQTDVNGFTTFISGTTQTYQVSGAGGGTDVKIGFDPGNSSANATISIASSSTTSRFLGGTYVLGGGADASQNPRSSYIDDANYGLRGSATANLVATSKTEPNGVSYANSSQQALLPWSAVVASNPNANAQYFPNANICACAYTQWGFWSVGARRLTQGDSYYDHEFGNLIPWVAGVASSVAQIPNSGSATYSGHAVANISNGGSQYIAAGNFSNTVNFARGSGTVAINNLDGRNYTSGVALSGAAFAGTVSPSGTPSAIGALKGSFYGPGSPPAEMGGQFQINNGSYLAGGVFVAKR